MGRELGKRWKNLSKKEKEPYIRLAAQKQIDYAKSISEWVMNNPERKGEILDDTPSKKRKKSQESTKKKKKEKMIPTGFQIFQREQRPLIRYQFFSFEQKSQTINNCSNKKSLNIIFF